MPNRQQGMTLVEVLVALVILGTMVATLLSLLSIHTRNAVAIQDRAMARIAAENAMVEVVIADERGVRLEEGGQMDVGGHSFAWTIDRTETPYEGIDNIIISVRPVDGDRVLASLSTVRPQ